MQKYYLKAPPGHTIKQKKTLALRLKLVFSLVFLTAGIASVTSVLYPIVSYQLIFAPRLNRETNLSPAGKISQIEIESASAQEPKFLPEMINTSLDYTDAATWFPRAEPQSKPDQEIFYTLSIPKLKIEDAVVIVGGTDLKKSLIHYGGTAMPGDLGNPVIYGHSVLPQFFDPKNYTSIFSTLYTLKKGDEIVINYEGVEYRYAISSMYEVEPDDIYPLAQSYDNYHLTLITCTPPGTYLRRLIVRAEII